MANCKFCGFETKSLGLSMHERFCKANPNKRLHGDGGVKKGNKPWCTGKSLSLEHRNKISESLIGKCNGIGSTPEKEELRKERIRKALENNPKSGGFRLRSGRGQKEWYHSEIAGDVYVRSSYEKRFVLWLDSRQLNWKWNKDFFEYQWENKKRKYYPDFYLPDQNLFVEIKGFKTKKDQAKWNQFPTSLVVIFGKDLEYLEHGGLPEWLNGTVSNTVSRQR